MSRLIMVRPGHNRAVIAAGPRGIAGRPGEDGRGVDSVAVEPNGHLIVTYSDSSTEDAGEIPGAKAPETDPAFTYTDGRVSRIDYASGAYKLFTYAAGVLTQLDYTTDAGTTRKSFEYNPDGSLAAIEQVEL